MDNIFNEADRIEKLILKSNKTPEKAILKLIEETGELVSALEGLNSYKQDSLEHVQEEAVDMLQCAMSVYYLIQKMKAFDGEKLMKAKDDKWESKYLADDNRKWCLNIGEGRIPTIDVINDYGFLPPTGRGCA